MGLRNAIIDFVIHNHLRSSGIALLIFAIFLSNSSIAAQDSVEVILSGPHRVPDTAGTQIKTITRNPRISLALSGGGTRGIAHIGVIKALEEAEIPISGIAGSSIGAIVGGLYAAGYTVPELEAMAGSIDWGEVFLDAPERKSLPLSRKSTQSIGILELRFEDARPYIPSALTAGQRISRVLQDMVNRAPYRGEPDFNHLKIPFSAVCTDLNNGERVLFRDGDLAEAIFASMAFPLLVAPVQYHNRLLIDGGIAENIPVHAAREMGDFVIAVNVTMPPTLGSAPYEPWVIANQVTGLMQQQQHKALLAEADFVISPLPDTLSNFSFSEVGSLIEMGYQAAMASMDRLKEKLSLLKCSQDSCSVAAHYFRINSQNIPNRELQLKAYRAINNGRLPRRCEIQDDLDKIEENPDILCAEASVSGDTLIYQAILNPIITSIEFTGVTQFDPSELQNILGGEDKNEDSLRYSDLRLEDLLRAYRRIGNPLAKIESIRSGQDGRVQIRIDEGKIRRIRIEGLKHLSEGRVMRDFNLEIGRPLNVVELNRSLDELFGSDLFNIVRATISDGVVTIKVQEKPTPRLRLGAGVDSERHGRGLVELSHESIPLLGGQATAWIKYGEFDERYELTYRNLAILKTYLEGSASLISSRTEYHYYDTKGESQGGYHFDRLGISAHIGQQFHTWGRLLFGFQASRVRSNYQYAPPELNLRKFFIRSELDTQDRSDFPSTGLRYDFLLETGASTLGGEIAYNRMQVELSKAQPITRRITVLARVRGGLCDQTTPFPEWFRLGGETSFYGLHYHELAGRQVANLSIEIREDLISRFLADSFLSIRGDVGAIWEDQEGDISTDDFMRGIGLSLALDTFLGPMSLSYGHLWGGGKLKERDLIYFNIGHRF